MHIDCAIEHVYILRHVLGLTGAMVWSFYVKYWKMKKISLKNIFETEIIFDIWEWEWTIWDAKQSILILYGKWQSI